MAEADAEDALPGGVEAADEVDEREDPRLVAVGVGAAAGDDEAVEAGRLGVGGELTADGAVGAPRLAVLLQQRAEHLEVAVVRLAHVLRVLAALQQRVRPRRRRRRDRDGGGRGGRRREEGLDGRGGAIERPHSHGWRRWRRSPGPGMEMGAAGVGGVVADSLVARGVGEWKRRGMGGMGWEGEGAI